MTTIAILFLAPVRLQRSRHRDGDVILVYTAAYADVRFILEFYRGDMDRGFVLGGALSTSQFIAAFMFVAVAITTVRRRRK